MKKIIWTGAAAAILSIAMAFCGMAEENQASLTGPGADTENTADTADTANTVAGPGGSVTGSAGTPITLGPGALITGELPAVSGEFTKTISDPVVRAVEKYSYDQMAADIQTLGQRYAGRLQTNVIGTSLDGRPIYELVIGNPGASKHVLIQAGIHAREYMTPLLVMQQLEYGLAFYDTESYKGQTLSSLFNQVAIHYVPMSNPDGICISQYGLSGIRSEELRQTITTCYELDVAAGRTSSALERYLIYWKANARGTDINQNFPAQWENVVGCANPSYATYKGAQPGSEPETQALMNLTNSRTWAATVSYHSMGNVIYWDFEGNRKQTESLSLANRIAGLTGYRLAGSSGHGGYKDWTQIKDNPIPGLTIEVGSVSCPLPLSEYAAIWSQNKTVWAEVAQFAARQ